MALIEKQTIIDELLNKGVDPEQIKDLHFKLRMGHISYSSFVLPNNQLAVPDEELFTEYSKIANNNYQKIGEQALKNDELLVFWLNGGAATRYFSQSNINDEEKAMFQTQLKYLTPEIINSPKGITEVMEGKSYLEIKILNLLKLTKELNLAKHPPVLLMNSFITDQPTKQHLAKLFQKYKELVPSRFHFVVQQPRIPRFTKVQNLADSDLFIDQKGHLSFAPAGHGDFLYLTRDYLKTEQLQQVKYMFFSNIDNFGSGLDTAILGFHIAGKQGRTVEVALKNKGDKGGAPCLVNGHMQIVEQMKFPQEFDQDQLKYFNTNNFWFTIADLVNYEEELPLIIAQKNIAGSEVLQLEHFACDVNLPSNFLIVPREKRFWPTKRYIDLLKYLYPNKNNQQELNISLQFNSLIKETTNPHI